MRLASPSFPIFGVGAATVIVVVYAMKLIQGQPTPGSNLKSETSSSSATDKTKSTNN